MDPFVLGLDVGFPKCLGKTRNKPSKTYLKRTPLQLSKPNNFQKVLRQLTAKACSISSPRQPHRAVLEFRTQLTAAGRSKISLLKEWSLRWVHSGAQLADALTKIMETNFLRETLKWGHYKLHDELEVLKKSSNRSKSAALVERRFRMAMPLVRAMMLVFLKVFDFLGV